MIGWLFACTNENSRFALKAGITPQSLSVTASNGDYTVFFAGVCGP